MRDKITVAGRELQPSPVFKTFWTSAAERHRIYEKRVRGEAPPWTDDPILSQYKMTNVFRAADRVSQYLIKDVIYYGNQSPREVVFRTLLFDVFKRVDTWKLLERELGCQPSWASYDFMFYNYILIGAKATGKKLFTGSYLMVARPKLGEDTQHGNYLRLVEQLMNDDITRGIPQCGSAEQVYLALRKYPGIGKFIGYQLLVDLMYGPHVRYTEDDFVVSGPGCDSGLRKMLGPGVKGIETEVLRYMHEHQHLLASEAGTVPPELFGRQMSLGDVEMWCCETDKYARAAFPEIAAADGRAKIKTRYDDVNGAARRPVPWFPPKWGINDSAAAAAGIE
jgi:hypothetical protein